MKIKTLVLFIVSIQLAFSQSKTEYLKNNRFDLFNSNFDFPQINFKIIGFGAYHGSLETEKAVNSKYKCGRYCRVCENGYEIPSYTIGRDYGCLLNTECKSFVKRKE